MNLDWFAFLYIAWTGIDLEVIGEWFGLRRAYGGI